MTAIIPPQRNTVRIPNLPMGRMVDDNGMPTDDEQTFRQALLTLLELIAGNEGLVAPPQTTANIATIVAGKTTIPIGNTGVYNTIYTCQFGTMLYNSTANSMQVAIDNGAGVPVIKTFTLV